MTVFDGPTYDPEQYHRGYNAGEIDRANPDLDLSSEEQVRIWDEASPSWKQGWAEAFDAPNSEQLIAEVRDALRKEIP